MFKNTLNIGAAALN